METASFIFWSEVAERSGAIRATKEKDTVDSRNKLLKKIIDSAILLLQAQHK